MKPIPSALKEKRRYIKFRLVGKHDFTENQVEHALKQAVFDFIGEKGFSEANFKIIDYDKEENTGLVRTTIERLDEIMVAMTLLDNVQGKKAFFLTYGISGTIKKASSIPAPSILKEEEGKEDLEKEMESEEILEFMESD